MSGIILYLSFLWLAYFIYHTLFKVQSCCNMCQNFLPFQGWIILHHVYIYIYHILFIHLSLDRYVACSTSWLLWVVLLWTQLYKYLFKFLLSLLLGTYPKVKLLGHAVILFVVFWGTTILFPQLPHAFLWGNAPLLTLHKAKHKVLQQIGIGEFLRWTSISRWEERAYIISSLPLASLPHDPHPAHK